MNCEILTEYTEGRSVELSEKSIQDIREALTRVFRTWEESYEVKLESDFIRGLTPKKLQKWYNAMIKGKKVTTINFYVHVLNPFLRWANEMGYTERDMSRILHKIRVPDVTTLPVEERPVDKYLTHEQAEALFNCKAGYNRIRNRAIIALILYSGLRVSEVCSLTIGHMRNRREEPIIVKRKGGHYVPVWIGEKFWPYLDEYLATREDRENDAAPLFMTSHGSPCDRDDIYRALSTMQKALGLATGPHALRHTFVSEVVNTCGAGVARDCANHSSLAVTNRYAHTTTEQRQAAVDSLDW